MQTNAFNQYSENTSKSLSALTSYARLNLPATVEELFDWGEFMWNRCGEYSQAINKVISYFLVDIDVTGVKGYDVKKKYKDYCKEDLQIMRVSYDIGKDIFIYGNSFLSLHVPFDRTLHCPKCKAAFPIQRVEYSFTPEKGGKFKGKCMSCKANVTYKRRDTKRRNEEFRIIRWNPRDIHIEYNQITEDCTYYYMPNGDIKSGIRNGDKIYMENTPWKIIQSVIDEKRIKFEPGKIKHMKYEGISSLKGKLKGWGIPPFFAAFDQVVLLNLLKRYNEAILIDYLIPFRFLSPAKGGPESDPLLDIDAGQFMRSVEAMISQQRSDPTAIHSIPYPVNYQAIGGEAKALTPVDLLKFTLETLFNTLGIPQEFFVSNLQASGPPIGLRIFERQHATFFNQLEDFLVWVGEALAEKKLWEDVHLKYVRTSVYEDEKTKEIKLQMLASNKVSNGTALKPFGIDYEEEIDRIIDEQEMFDEKMMEVQRNAQMAGEMQGAMDTPLNQGMMGGDPAMMQGGGVPPAAGGGGAMAGGPIGSGGQATLDETHMQAEQMAQEIMMMDPSTRKSQLIQLSKTDETLHALVKEKLRKLEDTAAQQGLNMTRAGEIPPPGVQ
jgi:hypothetical protein